MRVLWNHEEKGKPSCELEAVISLYSLRCSFSNACPKKGCSFIPIFTRRCSIFSDNIMNTIHYRPAATYGAEELG